MVQRAEQFSPNAVDKDRAILDAVAERLHRQGHQVSTVSETALAVDDPNRPEWVFSMGRLPETLRRESASAFARVRKGHFALSPPSF
jgi:hypothetical protein